MSGTLPRDLWQGLSHKNATVSAGPTYVSELTGLGWRNGGEGRGSARAERVVAQL